MSDLCEAKHDSLVSVYCTKKKHDDRKHAALRSNDEVVRWEDPPKLKATKAQIKEFIESERAMVKRTTEDVQGTRGVLPDVFRSLMPVLDRYLTIMESMLDLLDD